MAIWEAVRGGPVKLRPEWHEFIAYAVQLDLMDPQLRRYVLNANTDVRPSESLLEINEFTSRMDPDTFAVTAYKTYLAQGAGTFVSQLLRGEIVPHPSCTPSLSCRVRYQTDDDYWIELPCCRVDGNRPNAGLSS